MHPLKMDLKSNENRNQNHSNSILENNQSLNIDLCLELIFPYLGLSDLVSAADSNKQMKNTAELIFSRRFGRKFFVFSSQTQHNTKSMLRTTYIDVRDPKVCLGLLRCFGHLISRIQLDYYFSSPLFCSCLDLYVVEYCATNLIEFEIYGYENALKNLRKPFPNVEKVRLIMCDLSESSTRFKHQFPNVRSLEFARDLLVCTQIGDQSCIAEYFPNLEHLSVHLSNDLEIPGYQEESLLAALKLNPKLRSLCLNSLYYEMSPEFLRKVSKTCECLEILEIKGYLSEFSGMVHFKNVKVFSIYSIGCPLISIPFTFDALEIFSWEAPTTMDFRFILDFVENNQSITKLKFSSSLNVLANIDVFKPFTFAKEVVFRRLFPYNECNQF